MDDSIWHIPGEYHQFAGEYVVDRLCVVVLTSHLIFIVYDSLCADSI